MSDYKLPHLLDRPVERKITMTLDEYTEYKKRELLDEITNFKKRYIQGAYSFGWAACQSKEEWQNHFDMWAESVKKRSRNI